MLLKQNKRKPSVREMTTFGVLGGLMYASKVIMEVFPNIHLIGVFVVAITLVYRRKALYPIYIYVLLCGLFMGFSAWWIPQLYIWTVLWGFVMLLPKCIPPKIQPLVYMSLCAAHGLLYGTLYAPVHAILFGLDFSGMVAWILVGLPWDVIHGIGNLVCGVLIVPIVSVLKRASVQKFN